MIENMNGMLKKAKQGKYGVGAFNFNEFTDLKALVHAAAENSAPVILMASGGTVKFFGIKEIVHAYRCLAEDTGAACALHLDHCKDIELLETCVNAGFTSVMIDASTKPFDENAEITKRVVEIAHGKGVSVEAELGTVAGREEDIVGGEAEYINPGKVGEFIEKTGIDALAVGIGTVHGFYKQEPHIRFDLIEEIAGLTDTPLVMHGGTGLSVEDFQRAIRCGISKVNVGTELKFSFSSRLCEIAKEKGPEGDPRDFMRAVYEGSKTIAAGKMKIFGCAGKA